MSRAVAVVVCCLSSGAVSCVAVSPEGERSPAPARATRLVSPTFSANLQLPTYTGDVPDFISAQYGLDMTDMDSEMPSFGGDFYAGVRFCDLFGVMVGYGLMGADATAETPSGVVRMPMSLEYAVIRAETFFPILQRPPIEVSLAFLYLASAELLDDSDDGFRDGSGLGFEVSWCERTSWDSRNAVVRFGVGWRRFKFKERVVMGSTAAVNDSLRAFYITFGVELRF